MADSQRVKDAKAIATRVAKDKDANLDLQSVAASFQRVLKTDDRLGVHESYARAVNNLAGQLGYGDDSSPSEIPPGDEPLAPEPSSEDKGARPAKEGQGIEPGDTPRTSDPDTTARASRTRKA